jgi:hypothetical protein
MATAAFHLRPAAQPQPAGISRDIRAVLIGLVALTILMLALLVGSAAAGYRAPSDVISYPSPEAGLDR